MSRLRVYHVVDRTHAEGPGVRACVWVQGCSIRCAGCFNPHTWAPEGGQAIEPDALGERLAALEGIEGITFLGGEPFDQAGGLATVAERVRVGGRSVMTFTGHSYEELLAAGRADWGRLLAATDLLVDGPYDWRRPDRVRPWVGSTNQRFRFLSARYAGLEEAFGEVPDRVEIRLHPDGRVWMNGMAPPAALAALRREIRGSREPASAGPGGGRP